MDRGDATTALKLKLVEDTARRFAAEQLTGRRTPQIRGRPARALCSAFGELGLGLAPLPARLGGLELGAAAACQIAQLLAAGDPALAFALPQPGAFAELMLLLGSDAQQVEWLDSFGKAPERTWGAVTVTPQEAPTVSARPVGEGWVIDGTADHVWHLGVADRLLVVADAGPQGRQGFVLPLPCHGVTVALKQTTPGLQAATCGSLTFEAVRVEAQQHLRGAQASDVGAEALPETEAALRLFYARQGLRMSSYAVVGALSSARYALNFAEQRRAAGRPIEHYNVLGFLLADMHLACEASAERLLTAAETGAAHSDAETVTMMLQARQEADDVALSVVDSAANILNDLGHAPGHPVERWLADVRTLTRWGKAPRRRRPRAQA
jgi:alkylation response protein AidB-like acyl-CoA dehydrogenase